MGPGWLVPEDFAVPGVGAVMSTRAGGCSTGPYESLNLGAWVGDEPSNVSENMRRFASAIGAQPVFLKQVHGTRVLDLDALDPHAPLPDADASITTRRGIACTVTVADCLPVLIAAPEGRAVGAAHAGWRGLAGGVLEATVKALCEASQCDPSELHAWLGACIGPSAFEVGEDVVKAFGEGAAHRFAARRRADGSDAFVADLAGLARDRLAAQGLHQVVGGHWCTVEAPERFFSYRRDRVCGRMAAALWRR